MNDCDDYKGETKDNKTMTNARMAELLSIRTHRDSYPVVNWIEENIRTGKATGSLPLSLPKVIDLVKVCYYESIYYKIKECKVAYMMIRSSGPFFSDNSKPEVGEIDLIEVCSPDLYTRLENLCLSLDDTFKNPYLCDIEYIPKIRRCRGCNYQAGPVNYQYSDGSLEYFCGKTPRCCP